MNATVQAPAENEPKLSKADAPLQANSGPQETAGTPPSVYAPSGPAITHLRAPLSWFGRFLFLCVGDPKFAIGDRRFIQEIRKLQLMRSIQQGEGVGPKDISELWPLLQLRYAPFNRLPTKDEWIAVDNLSVVLFSKEHADLRKKFVSSQVPMLITWLPLLMLIVAGVTLCLGVYSAADTQSSTLGSIIQKVIQFLHNLFSGAQAASAGTQAASSTGDYDWCVASYLFWSVSMGVIGAAASVGMNAISVLNDTTFDISNRHQIWLRVILGGVFALVLALPFGLENFALFCYYAGHLLSNDATPTTVLLPNATATVLPPNAASTTASIAYVASRTSSLTYAFALLVPFLLGFSTSLVTNVLSTLINWAQKCFDRVNKGLSGKGTQSGQAGTAQAPQSGTASATT